MDLITRMPFKLVFSAVFLLLSTTALHAQKNGNIYEDEILNPKVKSVLFYPETGTINQTVQPPIISLRQARPLRLEFDILEDEYRVLQARIIHCNADWTKSALSDLEYTTGYNGYDIQDIEYSGMSKQLYVNYWFRVPRVKISGNYVLQVYQNSDPEDVVLTRRFIVYEENVQISPRVRVSTVVSARNASQQVDFSLVYTQMRVSNPMNQFKVVIRQNDRWDNAITDLKPTQMDPNRNTLDYMHFGGENTFKAGNEFRFIDLRTFNFRGRYVAAIDKKPTPMRAETFIEKSRANEVYSELHDMNGAFIISTMESGANYYDADYLNVRFRLKASPSSQPVYVVGAFNFWKKDRNSEMQYDRGTGTYYKDILLKQGIYDYMFYAEGDNPLRYEGSFVQTNNHYDIIVYYRSFTDLTDRVVGYRSFLAEL